MRPVTIRDLITRRPLLNAFALIWGAAEAMLFFIVPDVVISYIGLRHGVRASAVASVFAAVGAGLGGVVMFLWSARDAAAAHAAVLAVPAISEGMTAAARLAMAEHGWFTATLLGPLSSTPFKVYAIFAPHAGAPLLLFAAASMVARLPRFFIVGAGVALIGRRLKPRLGRTRLIWTLAAAWTVFYAMFFALVPS
jgi:membrane protein YqaA with SNARE-associated domain